MQSKGQVATRILYNLSMKLRDIGKQYENQEEFKGLNTNKPISVGKTILPSSLKKISPSNFHGKK